MGQKEGAEPNAGHAAAPTALRGLKITMFTHFQSWVSAALSGGLETSLCPRPRRTPSTGLARTRALGFVSLGGCGWREVRKAAHAAIPGGDCSLLADSSSSRRSEMQDGKSNGGGGQILSHEGPSQLFPKFWGPLCHGEAWEQPLVLPVYVTRGRPLPRSGPQLPLCVVATGGK